MLMCLLLSLFRKRCPQCRAEVHKEGHGVVQRFGRWFCSEVHADLYESDLFEVLQTARCHHRACHGGLGPLPGTVNLNLSLRRVSDLTDLEHHEDRYSSHGFWDYPSNESAVAPSQHPTARSL
jgi:hypothetical protein